MSIPNDTFHRPGNHVLGAGVVYFSTSDGGPERPIIETDQLTLQTEVESVTREDSVDGPRHVDDSEIVSVRRTLSIGTSDIIEKNLELYFGDLEVETVAGATGTKTITGASVGEWFQIVEPPQPLSVSSVVNGGATELTEGVHYQLDLQRGRIQVLSTGNSPTVDIDIDYESEGARLLTVGPQKAKRGQLRFISDPSKGDGFDLYFPSVVLKPSNSMEFKSRAEWMRIGLEIEVLGSIIEMVQQTTAVVSSPPTVITISQSEPLTISAEYPVDIEGATIEFEATRRGGALEIDLDYASNPTNFTVDDQGNVDVVLSAGDTNVTLGTYDSVLRVTDGSANVDTQDIIIVVEARETLDLGAVDADLVATPVAASNAILAIGSLAAYYKGEDDVTDSSGNGYDGTDAGSTGYATGLIPRSGKCFDFSGGGGSNFSIPDTNAAFDYMLTTAVYSIAFWFEWDGQGAGGIDIPIGSTVSSSQKGVAIFFDDRSGFNQIRLFHSASPTARETTAPISAIPDSGLHHIVAIANGDGVAGQIYVDGVDVTNFSEPLPSAAVAHANNMNVGRDPGNAGPFDGRIDELAFFTKSLSAGEVASLYAEGP